MTESFCFGREGYLLSFCQPYADSLPLLISNLVFKIIYFQNILLLSTLYYVLHLELRTFLWIAKIVHCLLLKRNKTKNSRREMGKKKSFSYIS